MKSLILRVMLSLPILYLSLIGCSKQNALQHNRYTSSDDTLVIKTRTIKGCYPGFRYGAGRIAWEFNIDSLVDIVYPVDLDNRLSSATHIDIKPFMKMWLEEGIGDTAIIRQYHLDTSEIEKCDWVRQSIILLKAIIDNDTILIVDANDNKDLTDDERIPLASMDWYGTERLIMCSYMVREGDRFIKDSSWLNIGTGLGGDLLFVAQHERCEFMIDDLKYEIVIHDQSSHFTYERPELVLIAQNDSNIVDTVTKDKIVKISEFILLGENYYKFIGISNTGKEIILVKADNFKDQVGTQVGMIAPNFTVKTVDGSILEKDYPGSTLLANVTACNRDTYRIFEEMAGSLKNEMRVIPIESGVSSKLPGLAINAEDPFNEDFNRSYRDAYSSSECLLISEDGRIAIKFRIEDWRKFIQL